jgi:hypothetical protein
MILKMLAIVFIAIVIIVFIVVYAIRKMLEKIERTRRIKKLWLVNTTGDKKTQAALEKSLAVSCRRHERLTLEAREYLTSHDVKPESVVDSYIRGDLNSPSPRKILLTYKAKDDKRRTAK